MKPQWIILPLALLLILAFGGAAAAHVTVQPTEVPANSYQVFTLRVPTEKEVPTTRVRLEVPAEVNVSRFEPEPGWTYELEKDADGKITVVTWKAEGEGLGPTEFGQFAFQGRVAENAEQLVWKAHQTYADGSVVDWTGAADSDTPASVTAVTAAAADGGHGHGAAAGTEAAAHEDGKRDPLTFTLAVAGFAAGLLALAVSLFRKGKRG